VKAKNVIETKTVTTGVPELQITLSIEEAKALLALGSTSRFNRIDFLSYSDTERKYTDKVVNCSIILGDLFHEAKNFLHDQELI